MSQAIGDFRTKNQNLIEASENPGDAAALVCLFLEDEIGGLSGNGWFDDDSLLGSDDEDDDQEPDLSEYNALYARMKRLQFSPFDMNWAAQVGHWLQGSDDPEAVQKLVAIVRKNNHYLQDFTIADLELMTPQLRAVFNGVIVGTPESVSYLYQSIDCIAANGDRGNVEILPSVAKARLGVAS